MFGCLRRSSVLSFCAVAAAIVGLFVSCNNPFRPDMGEQVVIGDARIYGVTPGTASFIYGRWTIEGRAWAHRELDRVEVRITGDGFAERGLRVPGPDEWTNISVLGGSITPVYVPGSGVFASWQFTLDTLDFKGGGIPLPDGRVTVQFRAADNVGPSEAIEVVYNVKNDPSIVNMVFPRLHDTDGYPIHPNDSIPVASGALIRGDVIDVKGLSPGYPMIQIWERAHGAEPGETPPPFDAEDPFYGWASVFLSSPVSVPAFADDADRQYYQWRLHRPDEDGEYVPISVNFANFTFRLSDFAVGDRRADGVRPAVSSGGLRSGYYYFRIRTRDISEGNAHGYFPPVDEGSAWNHVAIRVVENVNPPTLYIDNSDIYPAERLGQIPNIYITEYSSRIIARDDAHDDPYGRGEGPIFRLRVLARQDDRVGRATLRWEHPATGRGGYIWRTADNETGVPISQVPHEYRREVHFTFTATQGQLGNIFHTHPGQYVLTLRVYADVGVEGVYAERAFNLFMDGDGPNVEIRPSIRGAWGPPAGDAVRRHGGWINESPITVNGNVQVSIDRSAAFGILEDDGGQLVKWFLEPAGADGLPLAGDTVLASLARFRENPSYAHRGFFGDIAETRRSGRVVAPLNEDDVPRGPDGQPIGAYMTHHFKFNATAAIEEMGHDGRDLWLYVIAMDGVNNLGFAMQKIRVDEETDVPGIILPSFFSYNASGAPIEGPESLKVDVDNNRELVTGNGMNWAAGAARRNVLQAGEGIEVVLFDDDGINWVGTPPACDAAAEYCECDIRITLTALYADGEEGISRRIPHWNIQPDGSHRERMATLSQPVLGGAMGHGAHLHDGFYRLTIKVRDDDGWKVSIDGIDQDQLYYQVTYYFAVHTRTPVINVTSPRFDSLNHAPAPVTITGTVRSRFPIQSLWIRFDPHVLDDYRHDRERYMRIPLQPNPGAGGPGGDPDAYDLDDGMYVLGWSIPNVMFYPERLPSAPPEIAEQRNFSIIAFDALAHRRSVPHRVQVDASPPVVSLVRFNQLRAPGADGIHRVWGNVNFRVNVTDTHGLHIDDDGRLGIWWALVPRNAVPPDRHTIRELASAGVGGQFYFIDRFYEHCPINDATMGHTNYNVVLDVVFDSRRLPVGEEHSLVVMARDDANNWSYENGGAVLVERILRYPAMDNPTLVAGRLEPVTPAGSDTVVLGTDHFGNLYIRGIAVDRDGFHEDRRNEYAAIRFSTDGVTWGGWIYMDADPDPTGALEFRLPFYTAGSGFNNNPYIPAALRDRSGAVTVRYQIRVTDEPSYYYTYNDEPRTTLEDPLTTPNKNPQLGLWARFGTRYTSYPHHFPDPVGPASSVFPAEAFKFDNTPPVIEFEARFATTPTFRNVDDLMAALHGTIEEHNTHSFQISLGLAAPVTLYFGDLDPVPGRYGTYFWDLEDARPYIERMWRGDPSASPPILPLPPGTRNVVLVAEDAAGNVGRVTWPFIKDEEGPRVSFNNIGRSILHTEPPAAFPANWPSDWPHGDEWRAWPEPFRTAIANWPSDFALIRSADAVRDRIATERTRNATVITERFIEGDFDDTHGFIFDRPYGFQYYDYDDDPDALDDAYPFGLTFFYRLNIDGIGGGRANTAGWISVDIEHEASLSSASWRVALPPNLRDGEHTLDIRVRDNAGNWTELFGLRFVLDTSDPEFLVTSDDGGTWVREENPGPGDHHFTANWAGGNYWAGDDNWETMAEHRRVFSAEDPALSSWDRVFSLRGRVSDPNLRDLTARISSGGTDFVTSRAVAGYPPGFVDTETGPDAGTDTPPNAFGGRLSLVEARTAAGAIIPGEWVWTLDILERDVRRMRDQQFAGDGTRRMVSLVATDVANHRSETVQWPFYLDSEGPTIIIDELNRIEGTIAPSVRDPGAAITGTARDATGIQAVTFAAAQYDYEDNTWLWWDGTSFTLPARPGYEYWEAVTGSPPPGTSPDSVDWVISGDLFAAEGQYKVYVRATDWSLSVDSANGGNPRVAGGLSHRFFMDRGPPVIHWVDEDRQFFNDAALSAGFVFYVGDPNTIAHVSAVVTNAAGGSVGSVYVEDVDYDPTNANHNSPPGTNPDRRVTLRVSGIDTNEQFTLVVTVRDAAGNQTYMGNRRTFTRDNASLLPSVNAVVTRPPQAIPDTTLLAGTIDIGLAGNVTIRGAIATGTSPITGVRYALIPNTLPLPDDWATNDTWWIGNSADIGWRVGPWNADGVQIMRMEPDPSIAWTIDIPNTRNIPGTYRQSRAAADRPAIFWGTDSAGARMALPAASVVYLARLAVEADDESGNTGRRVFDLWIYPEGDRPRVTISSPAPQADATAPPHRLSGRFTLTGTASDNEHVHDVFFRALQTSYSGDALSHTFHDLDIPEVVFHDGEWVPGRFNDTGVFEPGHHRQTPRWIDETTGSYRIGGETAPAGYTPGWFRVRSGRGGNVAWSVQLNACSGLNAPGAGGSNDVTIQVVSRDASIDPETTWANPGWLTTGSKISHRGTTRVQVVSGAPEFSDVGLVLRDARGVLRPRAAPEELHIGSSTSDVVLTFDVSVLPGSQIEWIRFQQSGPAPGFAATGPTIDLIGAGGAGLTVTDGLGQGITSISAGAVSAGAGGRPTRTVTAVINVAELAARFPVGSGRFPLHISASDNSDPQLTASAVGLFLYVDNSPPNARMEFNPSVAGSDARLGGSASAWPANVAHEAVGRVDSVIVWFERIRGDSERRISWRHQHPDVTGTPADFRGNWVPVSNAAAWATATGVTATGDQIGRIQLPRIPASGETAGGDFAIVVNRNDPFIREPAQYGQSLATSWTMNGQQWDFSFNSTLLPSGPLDMHFVVFDRAGNATWARQRIVVMNDAPLILDVQIATDIRGGTALGTALNAAPVGGTGTGNLARTGNVIFTAIRGLFPNSTVNFGSPSAEELDIRRGISPARRPPTQAGLSGLGLVQETIGGPSDRPGFGQRPPSQEDDGQGARFHFADFTTRNNFLALGIQTVQPPGGEAGGRTFRVQHVSPAAGDIPAGDIVAGNAYMVVASTAAMDWSAVGAQQRIGGTDDFVFVAIAAGSTLPDGTRTAGRVRRLVPGDSPGITLAAPTTNQSDRDLAVRAELAFRGEAFGSGGISDYNRAGASWFNRYALFLVSVFDGPETDRFGDFTLISVRVNNNDQTPPFAQLYDLNPAAGGGNFGANAANADLSDVQSVIWPAGTVVGGDNNRIRAGLWRDTWHGNVTRPGHIEPRLVASGHSLTPAQMGQVAGDPERVNQEAFFEVDTVSGRVILRGYAEDDQRIGAVLLEFRYATDDGPGDLRGPRIPLLVSASGPATDTTTGLLAEAPGRDVFFTDTMDLFRHRVEWAFVWDTAALPAAFVVGDLVVRAIAVNAYSGTPALTNATNTGLADPPATAAAVPAAGAGWASSRIMSDEYTASDLRDGVTRRDDPAMRNHGFPANLYMYNSVQVNIRPYVTGFRRQDLFGTRRTTQGWYAFFRGGGAADAAADAANVNEHVVVTGFNLGVAGTSGTDILITGGGTTPANAVTSTQQGAFSLSSPPANRFRHFVIPGAAQTGNGLVRLRVTRDGSYFYAANIGDLDDNERPSRASWTGQGVRNRIGPGAYWWVQPWHVERSSEHDGSELWDNVTRAHIWQSNNVMSGTNRGAFPASRTGWTVYGTSMSINPLTGVLHASHNEGGGSGLSGPGGAIGTPNFSGMFRSTNDAAGATLIGGWLDPVIHSDIFVNVGGTGAGSAGEVNPWVVSSFIGRAGALQTWRDLGGLWLRGPGGGTMSWTVGGGTPNNANTVTAGTGGFYNVISTWYNASDQATHGWASGAASDSGATDQFWHPRVVTHRTATTGGIEHIHVAYFDSLTGSIQYRYNRRGSPGGNALGVFAGTPGGAPVGAGTAADNFSAPADSPTVLSANAVRRLWTNLDGGWDNDDRVAVTHGTVATGTTWIAQAGGSATANATTGLAQDTRIVNPPAAVTSLPGGVVRHASRSGNAGRFNDIDVTSGGFPVIVYFCETNNRLRMAISNNMMPIHAGHWHIVEQVIPDSHGGEDFRALAIGTGHYVSMRIDRVAGINRAHIAAHNPNTGSLVYISGTIVPPAAATNTAWGATDSDARNGAWVFDEAVVVDSVGTVGRRARISLDAAGNPWIAYLDTMGLNTLGGLRVAFRDTSLVGTRVNEDMFGRDISGWETMRVPVRYRVIDRQNFELASQLGMENFPTGRTAAGGTTRITPTGEQFWRGAVGFLSDDLFRIAYWVE